MEILTVRLHGDGYLVNGEHSVPSYAGNKDHQAVQIWIQEGNTPEPEFTQDELDAQAAQESNDKERETLRLLDLASIRDIRAYIAAQPDAPSALVKREGEAAAARGRLK